MRASIPLVVETLRRSGEPLRVRDIMHQAHRKFFTRAQKPENVIARDIAMEVKDNSQSQIVRVSTGLYAYKEGT